MLYKAIINTRLHSVTADGQHDRIVHSAQGIAALRGDGTWSVKYFDEENRGETVIRGTAAGMLLRRQGITNSRMTFEVSKKTETFYQTAVGLMEMSVETRRYVCELTDDGGKVLLDYDLYIAGQRVGRNELELVWDRKC